MSTPIVLPGGRYTVPGNRWDLLAGESIRAATTVAVVIPFYEQQADLDLVLAALELQDYPPELVEVVVADDGSRHPPDVSACSLPCRVVRQQDRGFRAAAARNLGARHSTADILCFLDADTVPEPGYLSAIVRLPSVCPDALVVGRRRHANLTGWTPDRLPRWWSGESSPEHFPEPRWLSDAYAGTRDLLDLDHRSYRYVISSVMCCSRELFDYCRGFDESFDRYGGEDWEFTHRALCCGAVLAHCRDAVAWHDGPDWAGRDVADRAAVKNGEALAVARLVTDPEARGYRLHFEIPDVAVQLDAQDHGLGSLVHTASSFLGLDAGIWVAGAQAAALVDAMQVQDPRIRLGAVPDRVRRSCRSVVTVTGRPVLPAARAAELIERVNAVGVSTVAVRHGSATISCAASWALHRRHRWGISDVGTADLFPGEVFDVVSVERDVSVAW